MLQDIKDVVIQTNKKIMHSEKDNLLEYIQYFVLGFFFKLFEIGVSAPK